MLEHLLLYVENDLLFGLPPNGVLHRRDAGGHYTVSRLVLWGDVVQADRDALQRRDVVPQQLQLGDDLHVRRRVLLSKIQHLLLELLTTPLYQPLLTQWQESIIPQSLILPP